MGFCSRGRLPVFSRRSKSTKSFSISRSFSSSVISGASGLGFSVVPVIGLMGWPLDVVSEGLVVLVLGGGALNIPLLNK